MWTRGQSGYPQVTCRGRVEALGIRIESGRQKVLPVRRLVPRNKIVLVTTYLEMSVCDELLEDELQDEDEENPDEVEEAVEAEE